MQSPVDAFKRVPATFEQNRSSSFPLMSSSSADALTSTGGRFFDLILSRVQPSEGVCGKTMQLMLLPMLVQVLGTREGIAGFFQRCEQATGRSSVHVVCCVASILVEGTKQDRYAAESAACWTQLLNRLVESSANATETQPPSSSTLSPLLTKWMITNGSWKNVRTLCPVLFESLLRLLVDDDDGPLSQARVAGVLDRSVAISLRPHSMGYLLTFGTSKTRASAIQNAELLWQCARRSDGDRVALRRSLCNYISSLHRGFSLKSLRWVELHCAVAVVGAISHDPPGRQDDGHEIGRAHV